MAEMCKYGTGYKKMHKIAADNISNFMFETFKEMEDATPDRIHTALIELGILHQLKLYKTYIGAFRTEYDILWLMTNKDALKDAINNVAKMIEHNELKNDTGLSKEVLNILNKESEKYIKEQKIPFKAEFDTERDVIKHEREGYLFVDVDKYLDDNGFTVKGKGLNTCIVPKGIKGKNGAKGRIVYGSPYNIVMDKAISVLRKLTEEYNRKCCGKGLRDDDCFEDYDKAALVSEIYERRMSKHFHTFDYNLAFICSNEKECKKAIRQCVLRLKECDEFPLEDSAVNKVMDSIVIRMYRNYVNYNDIPYIARHISGDKMIASCKEGVTNDDIIKYLKKHRIGYDIFEGCIVIR